MDSCDNKECGNDGCGGSCGDCTKKKGTICYNGSCCVESEACDNKECGDSCGKDCGKCVNGNTCVNNDCVIKDWEWNVTGGGGSTGFILNVKSPWDCKNKSASKGASYWSYNTKNQECKTITAGTGDIACGIPSKGFISYDKDGKSASEYPKCNICNLPQSDCYTKNTCCPIDKDGNQLVNGLEAGVPPINPDGSYNWVTNNKCYTEADDKHIICCSNSPDTPGYEDCKKQGFDDCSKLIGASSPYYPFAFSCDVQGDPVLYNDEFKTIGKSACNGKVVGATCTYKSSQSSFNSTCKKCNEPVGPVTEEDILCIPDNICDGGNNNKFGSCKPIHDVGMC